MVPGRTHILGFALALVALLVSSPLAHGHTCQSGCSLLRQACEKVAKAERDAVRAICDDDRDSCRADCEACSTSCDADRTACKEAAETDRKQAKEACSVERETCRSLCAGPVDRDCVNGCKGTNRGCLRAARNAAKECKAACSRAATRRQCTRACKRERFNNLKLCWEALMDCLKPCLPAACVDDSDCDDGDVCNGVEICQGGSCTAGTPLDCDDCNVCTFDSCHPVFGCSNPPHPGCDGCVLAQDCADGNPCTRKVCECGACMSTPMLNGTPCPDGDVCNGDETCESGVCTAGTPLECDDGYCCSVDTCNTLTGCINISIPGCTCCAVGADCVDGDPCTDDVCTAGVCSNPLRLDGSSCGDGDFCNGNEICQEGTCLTGTPITACADGDGCCPAGCVGLHDDDCGAG
jgi:hypothetical protein